MRRFSLVMILGLLAVATPARAHPGAGVVVAADGTIYFAVGPAHTIYRVTPEGAATPWITGALDHPFRVPHHLVFDARGRLYTASDNGSRVWRLAPDGKRTQIYPPERWDGRATVGLGGDPFAVDAEGRIIAISESSDGTRRSIVRIDASGHATLLAGGRPGFADGKRGEARFGQLGFGEFVFGPDGSLYLTDDGRRVRRVSPEGGVWTIAGGDESASIDGPGAEARFKGAVGLAVAKDGTVYVAESRGRHIRRVGPDGIVSTLAGDGERGGRDGPAAQARFDEPVGVALDPQGRVLVLEYGRDAEADFVRVRRIDGAGVVATICRVDFP